MASQDERQLLAGFHQAMLDIYDAATRLKPTYRPTDFRRMVAEHGGKGAADRLLASSTPSSGFTELFLRGRENLRLSVEYLVLSEPWGSLFTPEQLAIARERLLEVGFEPPQADAVEVEDASAELPLPEELPPIGATLREGAAREITINAYERSAAARELCIAHHGTTCSICAFDFEAAYGSVAKGFIHVHHLTPLSEITDSYEVDPVADLRPVCPNCHAVIHLGGACRSIDEVRNLLRHRSLNP